MPVNEHPHVSIDDNVIGYADWFLDESAKRGAPLPGWVTLIRRLQGDLATAVAEAEALADAGSIARAALAAQPQPDAEQVAAWLTEHRWRGRIMAVGGGYTWGIGDVLAAREAVAGSATPPETTMSDIPVHAMLDVWMALGGEPAAFYRMWDEDGRTPADTWAQLMAAVGQRLGSLAADTNPLIGPEFDRLIFPDEAGSATPTGDNDD